MGWLNALMQRDFPPMNCRLVVMGSSPFLEPWIVFVCSKLVGTSYEKGFLLGGERRVVLMNQSLDFGHFPLSF
jgi:hypothetical protein